MFLKDQRIFFRILSTTRYNIPYIYSILLGMLRHITFNFKIFFIIIILYNFRIDIFLSILSVAKNIFVVFRR